MSELIDNRRLRIQALKQAVGGLRGEASLEAVRAQLQAVVRECDASDVAAMEQELIEEGVPVGRVARMCDLHSQAVRGVLVQQGAAGAEPGHPVDTFRRENVAIADQAAQLRACLASLADGPEDELAPGPQVEAARRAFALLMDVDKHYRRKEHLLFPFLEKRGITGPSTVMWGKDDEVRSFLKDLGVAVGTEGTTRGEWRLAADAVAGPALRALEEMIFKEERILLPMALQKLTDAEWADIASQSPQIGYCLVDPVAGWRPRADPAHGSMAAAAAHGAPDARSGDAASIVFPTGALSVAQLRSVFETLPVDLTFVDADDRVRFFSEGPNRVFHRAKAVIGRKVQHCHPPASVGTVERILADFRSGAQSVAEFWIEMRGRFVHVRYFALRDEAGAYQGTLEVTQDLTHERALRGERRLLQYES